MASSTGYGRPAAAPAPCSGGRWLYPRGSLAAYRRDHRGPLHPHRSPSRNARGKGVPVRCPTATALFPAPGATLRSRRGMVSLGELLERCPTPLDAPTQRHGLGPPLNSRWTVTVTLVTVASLILLLPAR